MGHVNLNKISVMWVCMCMGVCVCVCFCASGVVAIIATRKLPLQGTMIDIHRIVSNT